MGHDGGPKNKERKEPCVTEPKYRKTPRLVPQRCQSGAAPRRPEIRGHLAIKRHLAAGYWRDSRI